MFPESKDVFEEDQAALRHMAKNSTEKGIICISCGFDFLPANEEEELSQLCPECTENNGGWLEDEEV